MDCESSDENVYGMNFPVEDDVELKKDIGEEHKNGEFSSMHGEIV